MTKFGLVIPTMLQETPTMEQLAKFITSAEELGFSSLWTLDRILQTDPCLETLSVLSYASGITKRVRLGTAVLLLVLRNPILTAKELSTIDYLSGSRLTVGVSLGGRPPEFEAFSVNVKSRVTRFIESVRILQLLWSEPKVNFSGKHFLLKEVEMFPKPANHKIPILIGGSALSAISRAGTLGDGYIATVRGTPESFKSDWEIVTKEAARTGRIAEELEGAKLVYCCVDNDPREAYLMLKRWADRFYRTEFDVRSNCIFGSPDECVDKIRDYISAGVKSLILGPPTADTQQIETIRDKVLLKLR